MFDRFLRFAEARRALAQGRFEAALKSADDPAVRGDRRAVTLRERAIAGLLARAERQLDADQPEAALEDLSLVRAIDSTHVQAKELTQRCRERIEARATRVADGRTALTRARERIDAGDLEGAESLLAGLPADRDLDASVVAVRARIATARRRADELAERVAAALREGAHDQATSLLAALENVDHAHRSLGEFRRDVAAARQPELTSVVSEHLRAGDVGAALAAIRDVEDPIGVGQLQRTVLDRLREQVLAALSAADEVQARRLRSVFDDRARAAAPTAQCHEWLEAFVQSLDIEPVDPERAARTLEPVVRHVDGKPLRACLARMRDGAKFCAERLERARAAAEAGEPVAARAALAELATRHPMHEAARRELVALDRSAAERSQRMIQVRELVDRGRLREAYAAILGAVAPGPAGEEARLLLQDIRHRIQLVDLGLDQVRRSLHGADSGSRTGLRHCLARVEQLGLLQQDHEELERIRAGILAEIAGLDAQEEILAATARGDAVAARAGVEAIRAAMPALLAPERLEARRIEALDRIEARVRGELDAGRAAAAQAFAELGEALAAGIGARESRIRGLAADVAARFAQADEVARVGLTAMAARDLAAAERSLERARDLASDAPRVLELEAALRHVDSHVARIEEVSRLADGGDHKAARRRLDGFAATPPVLRTRIFDLKQRLARAQGLEGGFLLRVDEGGEWLVLRGDSIVVGNVRDGSADLPVLAAIAGRHARIRRTMSFHGGVQETIAAERGAISVNGEPTTERRLQHGDRIRLGTSLELAYELPSRRSLSSRWLLRGGFRVGGTDRVLLMKDRGRDGRILLGSQHDSHVRVSDATGEVELFAKQDGQVYVRCDEAGTMDDKPFHGEHPVTPGAWIRCAGVQFLVLPWSPDR